MLNLSSKAERIPKPILDSAVPRYVALGTDVITKIPKMMEKLDLPSNGICITGPTSKTIAGDHVVDLLVTAGFDMMTHVITKNDSPEITINLINEIEPSFIIAVGGGRIQDRAKYALAEVSKRTRSPELIVFPTLASHDGIASPCFIKSTEGDMQMTKPPLAIFADISIILSADPRYILSSVGDTLGKITATWDWSLAARLRNEPFSDYASAITTTAGDLMTKQLGILHEGQLKAARVALKALLLGGVMTGLIGDYRLGFGSEHMFAAALERIAPDKALHGERCGVGTILMARAQGQDDSIRLFLEEIGACTTAKDLNVSEEETIHALTAAHKVCNLYTILGEKGISNEAAISLCEVTRVFD